MRYTRVKLFIMCTMQFTNSILTILMFGCFETAQLSIVIIFCFNTNDHGMHFSIIVKCQFT